MIQKNYQDANRRGQLAKALNLSFTSVLKCVEWANCLFTVILVNGKKLVRFRSKNILIAKPPSQSGLYWITIEGTKKLYQVDIYQSGHYTSADIKHPTNHRVCYLLDWFEESLFRAFDQIDEFLLGKNTLIDFEPYAITASPLRSTSKAKVSKFK